MNADQIARRSGDSVLARRFSRDCGVGFGGPSLRRSGRNEVPRRAQGGVQSGLQFLACGGILNGVEPQNDVVPSLGLTQDQGVDPAMSLLSALLTNCRLRDGAAESPKPGEVHRLADAEYVGDAVGKPADRRGVVADAALGERSVASVLGVRMRLPLAVVAVALADLRRVPAVCSLSEADSCRCGTLLRLQVA